MIGWSLSLPGISTLVPGGYVDPSGLLGVTVTSPVLGSCSTSIAGVWWAGVVTLGTSSVGLPGSVILPVPVTFPSGKSAFGTTLPFPSSPIVTVIGWSLSLPGISTLVPDGYESPFGFLGVTVTSPVLGSCSNSSFGVLWAGVLTGTFFDGFLLGSVTVPVPVIAFLGRLSFGTSPEPLSPIVTVIVIGLPSLSSPGISTLVPDGYGSPFGFLGVTTASPFGFWLISIATGCSVVGAPDIILLGVSTGTSSVGFPGSVILPVPGTFPSGKSAFGTLALPLSSVVTVIGWSLSLPGISTIVPGGYVDPSGLFGVTVTSPVLGSCSNSSFGVLWAGVLTGTFFDGFLLGSVTVPVPGTSFLGSLSFGTLPEPSLVISTVIGPFSPGISTLVPGGYDFPSGFLGVTIASPFGCWVISIVGVWVVGVFGSVPLLISSSSGIPSLSSSESLTSGIPSPSVSRWILTGTLTTTSSVPFFSLTGISTVRSSSFGSHLSTVGVPTRFPPLSTVKPFTGLSVVIVVPGLFGVTTLVFAGTGVFSGTVFSVTVPVNLSATFGFASSVSGIPSLSSSESLTSGVPSPSVSRWILTGTLTTTSSVPFFSLTGISTVRSSSFGSHLSTVGVPTRFPPLSTVKPFTGLSVVIVVPGLFGVTTLVFAGTGVFSGTVFSVTVPVNLSATFGFASSVSGIPSLSSSGSVTSGIPSPSVSRWILTGTFTTVSSVPFFSLTGISTVRSSSSGFHLSTSGVPTRFPPLSTVKPFTGPSTVIVVPGLFGVTTLVLAGTGVFSGTVFPSAVPANWSWTVIFIVFVDGVLFLSYAVIFTV